MDNLPRTPAEYRAWWKSQTDTPYGYCWCGCGGKTSIAPRSCAKRFAVRGEPHRFVQSHTGQTLSGVLYVEENRGYETPCWIWQRHVNHWGYGYMRLNGKRVRVHRAFYEQKYGPLPADLHLHHLCAPYGGPRHCVNPDHLQPVTKGENNRKAITTKLTMEDAERIRLLRKQRRFTYKELGAMFGVTAMQICNIVNRRQWI